MNTDAPRPITPLPSRSFDAAEVRLGKVLFGSTLLSSDGSRACSSCHDIANGGDDGRRVSIGVDGRSGEMNAPTVLNSGLNLAQSWGGGALTLEDQILRAIADPAELNSSLAEIRQRIAGDVALAAEFNRTYEEGLTPGNTVAAIAAYVRALSTPNAPFDRYLSGDADAISAEALEGYDLFTRLGCISCHQGRSVGGNMFQHFGIVGDYFAERESPVTVADYGRYNVTGREEDRYKFKVPSLRNVARTAPYFHDGSAATLEEAVEIMFKYQLGRIPRPDEVRKIVAFLDSLSAGVEEYLR